MNILSFWKYNSNTPNCKLFQTTNIFKQIPNLDVPNLAKNVLI